MIRACLISPANLKHFVINLPQWAVQLTTLTKSIGFFVVLVLPSQPFPQTNCLSRKFRSMMMLSQELRTMRSLSDLWSPLPLAPLLPSLHHVAHNPDLNRVIEGEDVPFVGVAIMAEMEAATVVAAIFLAIAQFAAKSVAAKVIMPLLVATVMLQPQLPRT